MATHDDTQGDWMLIAEFGSFDGNTRESYVIGPFRSEADAYRFDVGPFATKSARRVVEPSKWGEG